MSIDRSNGGGSPSSKDSVSNNLGPAPGSGGSPPLNAGRKPVSARKLAANRANAARSTGPRSPEGKARVAMNALRHGLAAHAALLPGEDPEQLDALAEAYQDDLRPRGALERELVARIVGIAWRLRRIARAEEEMWEDDDQDRVQDAKVSTAMRMVYKIPDMPGQTAIVPDPLPAARFVARQFGGGDGNSPLERLAMYEQRLSRGLHAAIRELNALRKLRDGREEEDDDDGGDGVALESSEPIAKTQAAVGAARKRGARGLAVGGAAGQHEAHADAGEIPSRQVSPSSVRAEPCLTVEASRDTDGAAPADGAASAAAASVSAQNKPTEPSDSPASEDAQLPSDEQLGTHDDVDDTITRRSVPDRGSNL